MADITRTAAKVALTKPLDSMVTTVIAAEAFTAGQPGYVHSDGKAYVSDANDGTDNKVDGIAAKPASAGEGVDLVHYGPLTGYTLTSQAYKAVIYVSNTAGELADSAGGTSLPVGIVWPTAHDGPSGTIQKVLFVDIPKSS